MKSVSWYSKIEAERSIEGSYSKTNEKIVGYILGIIGLLGVDWFTKYLAQVYLRNRTIPIIGDFLQLRYVVNTGLS